MEKTLKKCWYITEGRVHLILTNIVLLSISSLIHVLLCKVRSPSRVAKIYQSIWNQTQIEVFYRYIYCLLVFVCIYVHIVGYIQYPLIREGGRQDPS